MLKIQRYCRAILIFYRGFRVPASLVTLFCCLGALYACVEQITAHKEFYGIIMFIAPFFWIKTITNVLILFYHIQFKAHEMYFYTNLGIRKGELWIITFLIDYIVFFTAVFLTGILGRNGSGKSCLLRIIFGTLQAQYSNIRFNGRAISQPYRYPEKIRYMPQDSFIPKYLRLKTILGLYGCDAQASR